MRLTILPLFLLICFLYETSCEKPSYVYVQSQRVYMSIGNGTFKTLSANVAINLERFDQITLHGGYEHHDTNDGSIQGDVCRFWMYKEGSDTMVNVQSFLFTRTSDFYSLREAILDMSRK